MVRETSRKEWGWSSGEPYRREQLHAGKVATSMIGRGPGKRGLSADYSGINPA